jgi:D-beta-D-heptose 7-phosphate kinase / D-beta-D-heptose 1-phosphate adenosyltransferase
MTINYSNIIEEFTSKRILVIGDLMLDVYLKGSSSRLSPEAPVPVVDVREKVERLGGAANTATNLKSLGAQVTLLSVVGMDDEGSKAIRLLKHAGIDTSRILKFNERLTLVKSRIMAGPHILTRFDTGTDTPVDEKIETLMIRYLEVEYANYDAIVISDYNKGIITAAIRNALTDLQKQHNKFLSVDSKRLDFFKSLTPSFVKPNYEEVLALLNLPAHSDRVGQLMAAGPALFAATGARIAAITLDSDGALLFSADQVLHQPCAETVNIPNVVGAGDTFVSAFTLSAVSGANIEAAGILACAAASITVGKEGTASCAIHELKFHFNKATKEIQSLDDLSQLCSFYRSLGKRIVFTNGCFDILHSGHVSYLNRARQLGDVLVVGVNNDESIRRFKGASRPINPLSDRIGVLTGLAAIDHVISFGKESDDTPIELIRIVKPDIFVKGGDYTREKLPEASAVEAAGGEIVFLPLVADHSTTQIIQQIHQNSTLAVA